MKTKEHSHELGSNRLSLTIGLNVGITLAQAVGGFISGSLALLSDAMHNFSDVTTLLICWFSNRIARRKQTAKQTFGYKRAEILAALFNAVSLIVIAFFLFEEAVARLLNPVEVEAIWIIALSGLSIVLNALSVLLIKRDAKKNINMRAAYFHLFSDMLSSIAVLVGGIVLHFWHINQVDSILSLAIAVYLVWVSWKLIVESVRILMQFAPVHINLEEINKRFIKIKGVRNMHHVHIWQLNDNQVNFEAHIGIEKDLFLGEISAILHRLEMILRNDFEIHHVTLQPEIYNHCKDESIIVQEDHNDL